MVWPYRFIGNPTCIEDPPVSERILYLLASKDLHGLSAESRSPPTSRAGFHH